ncbi:hypothetical protein GCM10009799_52010 [Nocardiopsis rhodophaea]|uniref:Uncharacterized protein n=1 Tax=Nocardiopsis rhodophaea TaxID=280238 RepID=A0ABN2TS61_9ACTN
MHKIEVNSYLREQDGTLVPVADWCKGIDDSYYIEGAIEIFVDGRTFMDIALWDYVDQLWAYILNILVDLRTEKIARTYFPDQPIELSFRRVGHGRLLATLEVNKSDIRTVNADEAEFTEALLSGASHFFNRMHEILPGAYTTQLDKIDNLRN